MPKQISDERIALVLLDTPPADPDNITVAEFDAGTHLECRIMDYRLSPAASDTVQMGELCTATNAQVPTRSNYEGTVTVLRYLDASGLADSGHDMAWQPLRQRGHTRHLVPVRVPRRQRPRRLRQRRGVGGVPGEGHHAAPGRARGSRPRRRGRRGPGVLLLRGHHRPPAAADRPGRVHPPRGAAVRAAG